MLDCGRSVGGRLENHLRLRAQSRQVSCKICPAGRHSSAAHLIGHQSPGWMLIPRLNALTHPFVSARGSPATPYACAVHIDTLDLALWCANESSL